MDSSNDGKEASFNSNTSEVDARPEPFDVTSWLDRITKARNKEQAWRDRSCKIINIYRDDNSLTDSSHSSPRKTGDNEYCFNILFANTETLLPALFSHTPKPDIRNRYLNQDPNAEGAGDVIERSLVYSMDTYKFANTIKMVVKDHLLTGRGVARARLEPYFETKTMPVTDEMGQVVGEQQQEVLVGQQIKCECVDWDSLVIEPCKKWEDVSWIAFIHMLTREEFLKYFPDRPLVEAEKKTTEYSPDPKYKVYEIWDKAERKVYYISQSETPLKIEDDPLQLTNFWPIPEPLYSIKTSDTLVPIPEYTLYQSQAEELNKISFRIMNLVNSARFRGIYDAGEPNIGQLFDSEDSEFVAVTTNRMREGGADSLVSVVDTSKIAVLLGQLYAQRDQIKAIIYEVTGISDIIRGDSKASETATAQSIKASYAGLRLRDRRDNINSFVVDLLRIQAEMLCTFFGAEQLQQMTGVAITPEIEAILRSDVLRNYKIDVETDSTILPDMQAETQQRAQLVGSITQYLTAVTPLVAQGVLPLETAKALLTFGLQPAKISRELEDALEMIGNVRPPPPPALPLPQAGGMPMPAQNMPPDIPQGTIEQIPAGLQPPI